MPSASTRSRSAPARRVRTRRPAVKPSASKSSASGIATRKALGMTQVTFARLLGVSLRTLSNTESSSSALRPDMLRRLKELERLVAALRELMAPGALRDWMITPSDAFEGSTPVQLIERGEADRIWQMVFALRTGQPM